MLLQSVGFMEINHEYGYGIDGVSTPITFTAVKA